MAREKNRKRYQRRLDLRLLVGVVLLGAACAATACGFVLIKNAHVSSADARRDLEREIEGLEEELRCIDAERSAALPRHVLAAALRDSGSDLVPIEFSRRVIRGDAGVPPAALAVLTGGGDRDVTIINVENPGGS